MEVYRVQVTRSIRSSTLSFPRHLTLTNDKTCSRYGSEEFANNSIAFMGAGFVNICFDVSLVGSVSVNEFEYL